MTGKFSVALPKHIPVERFKRVVLTAINLNPDLLNADRRSLFNSASKAANDGLLPDGREGALVIFRDNKTGKDMCQWMPMVFGILKKLRQSAEIAAISARCVYKNEVEQGRFSFSIADGEEHLKHDPILFGDRGPVVGVYAVAKFKDGTVQHEPLTMEDIAKIRAVSRTGKSEYGPWSKWFDEMCRKSAIRRLSKYLPVSAEDLRSLDRDFHDTEVDQIRSAVQEPQSIGHAAAALAGPTTIDAGDGEQADAGTGEIIEGQSDGGGNDAGDAELVIQHIGVDMVDGNPHWKTYPDKVTPAIEALPSVAAVNAWVAEHQGELDGIKRASAKMAADVIGALDARRLELEG